MLHMSTSSENLPVMVDVKDRSFHMDRGKIVCNGCGGHFPNLVLFENHTHTDEETNQYANKPSRKSGPKTLHKTFDTMTPEEMMADFKKMKELAGCYYKDEKFNCCICGKGFKNPYTLFSHRIVHPADMVPTYPRPASIKTQTPKVKYYLKKSKNINVLIPELRKDDFSKERREVEKGIRNYLTDSDDDSDSEEGFLVGSKDSTTDDSESNDDSPAVPRVSKAIVSTSLDMKDDEVDEALPIRFKKNQEMMQVPWVSFKKLKRNMTKTKGSRTYVYRMLGNKSEMYTPVNSDLNRTASNVVMVSPKVRRHSSEEELEMEKISANPYGDKGLLFTDMDDEKMKKVFSRLPGLKNCRITNQGMYRCDKCRRVEDNPYKLFIHRLTSHEVKDKKSKLNSYESMQTNLVFYRLPGLNRCKVKDGQYFCDMCDEKFANPYLLFTHKISHDSTSTEATNVLKLKENSDFGSIFGEDGLANIKVKNGRYYCDRCPLYYSSPYLLLNHKMLHKKTDTNMPEKQLATSSGHLTEDVKLELDSDSESVDGELELIFQKREPEEEICYECNICEMQFETIDGLSLHIESHGENKVEVDDDLVNQMIESSFNTGQKRKEDDKTLLPSTSKKIKTEPARLYPGEATVTAKTGEATADSSEDWIEGYTAASSSLWTKEVKTEVPEEVAVVKPEASRHNCSAHTTIENSPLPGEMKPEVGREVTPAIPSGERTQEKISVNCSAPPSSNFVPQPQKIKVKITLRPPQSVKVKEAVKVKPEKEVGLMQTSGASYSMLTFPDSDNKLFNAVVPLQRVNIKPGQTLTLSKNW